MLARRMAMGLLEIEVRMRRIHNCKKLYLLRKTLKRGLKLDQKLVA